MSDLKTRLFVKETKNEVCVVGVMISHRRRPYKAVSEERFDCASCKSSAERALLPSAGDADVGLQRVRPASLRIFEGAFTAAMTPESKRAQCAIVGGAWCERHAPFVPIIVHRKV